ncbi:MAG TPA: ABC transporter permease [Trueperaceae bacterium]|nr:ABC transporter permease [Trueperaceae bacterium]
MVQFLLKRLLAAIPVALGVSILAFSMSHLTPGDPVTIMLGARATAGDIVRLRHELGLDQPLPVQYWHYLTRALHGDLGTSIRSGQPVTKEIAARIGSTAELTGAAMLIAVLVGVTLGTLAAVSRSAVAESVIMTFALLGISMPTFWSGLLFIMLFSLTLRWLPVTGPGIAGLVLPAVTLALPAAAVLARMTRSSLLEVLGQDYIRTARSKGVASSSVTLKHGLRNAFIPVLTIVGLQFGGLMAGSVIVESVFARPGIGRFAVDAILARDFPQIQGIVLLAGLVYVTINTVIDLLYGLLDPRIQVA